MRCRYQKPMSHLPCKFTQYFRNPQPLRQSAHFLLFHRKNPADIAVKNDFCQSFSLQPGKENLLIGSFQADALFSAVGKVGFQAVVRNREMEASGCVTYQRIGLERDGHTCRC